MLLFFNDPATTEIYTLSLHDALPIWLGSSVTVYCLARPPKLATSATPGVRIKLGVTTQSFSVRSSIRSRSEEHTSELQSPYDLVCRLLLEKKKTTTLI